MAKLPTGIYQRGAGFRVKVEWQGSVKTGSCNTLEQAIAMRARLDAELKNPHPATLDQPETGGNWSLGIAFDRTVAIKWHGSRAEHSSTVNAQSAVDFFGRTRKLDTIDTDAIDGYVAALIAKGNADGTINRKLAALSCMFNVAFKREKVKRVPEFPRRKESLGRVRFISQAEETTLLQLFNQWDKLDEADALVVLVDTGLRLGEFMQIDGERDIDHRHRALNVWKTKGNLPRTVPLTTRAYDIIKRRSVTHRGKLFPYHEQWMRHTWDRAKALMGLVNDDQFVIHALRHTFASRLVQRGVPIQMVQQLLGHKDIKMTMRYAHLCPTNLTAAVAVLEGKPFVAMAGAA